MRRNTTFYRSQSGNYGLCMHIFITSPVRFLVTGFKSQLAVFDNCQNDFFVVTGQPVYVPWKVNRHFHVFQRHQKDCARMCQVSGVWKWTQEHCDISSVFLCEYGEMVYSN